MRRIKCILLFFSKHFSLWCAATSWAWVGLVCCDLCCVLKKIKVLCSLNNCALQIYHQLHSQSPLLYVDHTTGLYSSPSLFVTGTTTFFGIRGSSIRLEGVKSASGTQPSEYFSFCGCPCCCSHRDGGNCTATGWLLSGWSYLITAPMFRV